MGQRPRPLRQGVPTEYKRALTELAAKPAASADAAKAAAPKKAASVGKKTPAK